MSNIQLTYTLQPKAYYRRKFQGSNALYDACWRQYSAWLRTATIEMPTSSEDVIDWLDSIAEGLVNDSRSKFCIYG